MTEIIKNFLLESVGKQLCVFLCAMLPVIELRGALPFGCVIGLPFWQNYLLSVAGNLLPVPFILLFIRAIINQMKKSKHFCKIAVWLEKRAAARRGKVEKYAVFGLYLFVAIPLPMTGAWMGALIAALMEMKFGRSMLFITAGVLTAGVIVSLITYSVSGLFSLF